MLGITHDPEDIRRTWALIAIPDHLVEVRILRHQGPPGIGRFTNIDAFDRAVRQADTDPNTMGVYVTLNPLRPDAPWSGPRNRIMLGHSAAKDEDVAYRRWLLIDLDPKRPTKTNATAAERQAAFDCARSIGQTLRAMEWPNPVQATSGNGAHLLYPLADWPNVPSITALVQSILSTLARQFTTARVDVDQSVFNASRISKVYGTVPKKGAATADRPWWPACCLISQRTNPALTIEQAQRIRIWNAPTQPHRGQARHHATGSGPQSLEVLINRLAHHGIEIRSDPIPYGDGFRVFITCPWITHHSVDSGRSETAIIWSPGHPPGFRCQHSGCANRTLKDVYLWMRTGAVMDVREMS
jgi:hypothetical protein